MSLRNAALPLFSRFLATTALTGAILFAAGAQAAQVRLTSTSGTATIEGELLSFEDGVYTVETVIGPIAVSADGVTCQGDGCNIVMAAATPEPVPALPGSAAAQAAAGGAPNGIPGERITLTSANGAIRIEGTLVAYKDDTYTIETVIGTLDIDAQSNVCEGPGCPTTGEEIRASVSTRLPTIRPEPAPAETAAATPGDLAEQAVDLAAVPDPEPAAETARPRALPQIMLASVEEGAPSVTLAGPASVIDGLLPALADLYAQNTGGTVREAPVIAVEPEIAVAAGSPAGRLAALVDTGGTTGLAVIGQLTATADEAIATLNEGRADVALNATQAPMMVVRNRTEAVLGNEALVAVVAPDNGVFQLAPAQLAAVLAGEVTNWREVGGADRPIHLYGLPATHDITVARDEMILAPFNLAARAPDQVFASEADLAAALSADPGALGFVSHAAAAGAKTLAVGSACGLTVAATPESIRTARYPFTRSLVAISFATDGPAAAIVNAIDTAGDAPVEAAGLEPVTLARFAMDDDLAALRVRLSGIEDRFQRLNASNALRVMPTSERLGTILTFDGRSNRLDTRSRAELDRILAFVASQGLGEVVVAGHVSPSGDPQLDKTTARGLAAGVRRALEVSDAGGVLDGVVVRAVGLGSVLPLECDDAGARDTLNRRVEIWVRR